MKKRPYLYYSTALVAFILCISCPERILAQSGGVRPSSLSPELDSLFTLGRFSELEIAALRRLHRADDFSQQEQIGATLFLGFLHVLQGEEDRAEEEFFLTLNVYPFLRLDPVYVPPRIYEVFERVRELFEARQEMLGDAGAQQESEISPIELHCLKTSSSLVSIISPGIGFLIEGKYVRGVFWTGVQAAATGYFIHAFRETDRARDRYMTNTDPLLFEERYNTYNDWYQRTLLLGSATIAVYMLAEADFHLYWKRTRINPSVTLLETDERSAWSGTAPSIGLTFTFGAGK